MRFRIWLCVFARVHVHFQGDLSTILGPSNVQKLSANCIHWELVQAALSHVSQDIPAGLLKNLRAQRCLTSLFLDDTPDW